MRRRLLNWGSFFVLSCLLQTAWAGELAPLRWPRPLGNSVGPKAIRVVYFVPRDRQPRLQYTEKITSVLTLATDTLAQSFQSQNLGLGQLNFEMNGAQVSVHVVRGRLKSSEYRTAPWNSITSDLAREGFHFDQQIHFVFADVFDPHQTAEPESTWPLGDFAFGASTPQGGGLAMVSSWVLTDTFARARVEDLLPVLVDSRPLGLSMIGNPGPAVSVGDALADGIGAVVHELGHALGLTHDYRLGKRGIMGFGFRFLKGNYFASGIPPVTLAFEQANLIARSPYLGSPYNGSDQNPPKLSLRAIGARKSGQDLSLEVQMEDAEGPLQGLILYSPLKDTVLVGTGLSHMSDQGIRAYYELTPPQDELGRFPLVIQGSDRSGNLTQYRANLGGNPEALREERRDCRRLVRERLDFRTSGEAPRP